MENGRMASSMDKEHSHSTMAVTIRGSGRIIDTMAREGSLTTKETTMTVIGLIAGQMEKAHGTSIILTTTLAHSHTLILLVSQISFNWSMVSSMESRLGATKMESLFANTNTKKVREFNDSMFAYLNNISIYILHISLSL